MPIDTTSALRTATEMRDLVEAIRDASGSEPETDAVEWKGSWDLEDSVKVFETARQILGFGNRTPASAAREFEGCAYLVAGVEPGGLDGVTPLDPATLENKLGRYIETGGPRWSPHYVALEGKEVLVIVIEAPREGDPIRTLQKGFNQIQAGRIFVRRHGKSEEASPADIRALEERIRGARSRVELGVSRSEPHTPFRAIRGAAGDKKAWLEEERERLAPPPPPKPKSYDLFDFTPPQISDHFSTERRSRKEYGNEVEAYLARAPLRWQCLLAERAISEELACLWLQIDNSTETNYQGVEVVLELPKGVLPWLEADEVLREAGAPAPPPPWGKKRLIDFDIDVPAAARFAGGDEIERGDDGVRVRFASRHVRPRDTVRLPPVYLTITEPEEVVIEWRLTSTGADGQTQGTIACPVESGPATISVARGI